MRPWGEAWIWCEREGTQADSVSQREPVRPDSIDVSLRKPEQRSTGDEVR